MTHRAVQRPVLGLAFALCAFVGAPPVTAQDTSRFEPAFNAFVRACIDPAPSFRGTPRAARAFGIDSFTFVPQLEDSNEFGMNYGYSFPIGNSRAGDPVPRGEGQLAISYTTRYRQIDRMCVVTYAESFEGLNGDQVKSLFVRSVQEYLGSQGELDVRGSDLEFTIGDFDYAFSTSQFGSTTYLYLHLWD